MPIVARRSRRAISEKPVIPIGPAIEVLDDEVELHAALALAGQALEIGARLVLATRTGPTRTSA